MKKDLSVERDFYKKIVRVTKLIVNDCQLNAALLEFIDTEFLANEFMELRSIDRRVGWIFLIINLKNKSINDLDWGLICNLHNVNLNEEFYRDVEGLGIVKENINSCYYSIGGRTGWESLYDLLNRFYLYLVYNIKYNNSNNIMQIKDYQHLLIETRNSYTPRLNGDKKYNEIYKTILNNFPLNSKKEHITQVEYKTINGTKKINFNTNTVNKFIKSLLIEFLSTFTKADDITRKDLRILLYYFVESMHKEIPQKYEEFNENIFKIQYRFYKNLGKELKEYQVLCSDRRLKELLVAFYRYLTRMVKEKYGLDIFTLRFIQVINLKSFYKFYENGFQFVYHNKLEVPPIGYKFCILPSIQTLNNSNSDNDKLMTVNLELINGRYKEDVKEFIWYADGYTRNLVGYLYKLEEFLEMKVTYDELNNNVVKIFSNSREEFEDDFILEYRSQIELDCTTNGHLKGTLKIIRKFLKYYKKKYNVCKRVLDILNLKGLGKFEGGKPIKDKDCISIYEEFEKLEGQIYNGRLYTIVFEIFLCSNLRIGEILNLKYDCLDRDTSTIKYFSKIGKGKLVKKKINKQIIILLEEAIDLTKPHAKGNDLVSKYIFTEPYCAIHKTNKRIDFYDYFKSIVENIKEKLEIKDYTPYNIRHTFINNVFNEGIKNGLSLLKMAAITGNSYKTCRIHYLDRNAVELYVETLAKVTITDVDILGNILIHDENKYSKVVKGELGKCNKEHCVFDMAECFLCNHFFTFINRIPAFEKRILSINTEIENSSNQIQIEELITEKKLVAKYLSEMIKLSQEKGRNN
ncbi:tyrosine-type recombinase/integrase [Clostridium magnum]|uniref:Phage integrase family protein n=1 Tax=Clostridium magnum DSM 2767 TaxID=1121326 RepID=A0A161YGV8_9CLOT|nr:tyrosine-type recombinase/integrase [Clostridium magnum]KZL89422.1 phage integrase family protein [Clostridium magnum DSM 2767]SHI20459.1 Phage integrase family protein [Clostridium magnum DSM 2767]